MKHQIVHALQKYVLNPPIKLLFAMGVVPPGYALLETIGRTTGKARQRCTVSHFQSGGHEVYPLFQKTALLVVTVICGVAFSYAEGACAHRIPVTENRAEDAQAFCVVNQDLGMAADAAINACGGHADKGHDRDHKCFVDSLWVQEGGGKWRTSGGSDSFPNLTCGAVAVAPAQAPAEILFFASSGNTITEASANAIGACDQENPSYSPHLKCSVIAAKACDTLSGKP